MSQRATKPSRWPEAALAFAICAVLSAWNPFAAPVGLLLGVATALLAWRLVSSKRGSRLVAIWALALGFAAAVASVVVLLLSSGALSTDLPGKAVVPGRSPEEVQRLLNEARGRTEAARGQAARELERLPPARSGDGGSPGSRRGGRAGPADEKKHESSRGFDSR